MEKDDTCYKCSHFYPGALVLPLLSCWHEISGVNSCKDEYMLNGKIKHSLIATHAFVSSWSVFCFVYHCSVRLV